jgi:hypothetical protein
MAMTQWGLTLQEKKNLKKNWKKYYIQFFVFVYLTECFWPNAKYLNKSTTTTTCRAKGTISRET